MNRTSAIFAVAILLTCGTVTRGQEPFDPALKKLMPKDQLDIAEQMEALTKKHDTQLFRIKDAKQRRVENEQLGTEVRQTQEDLGKKVKTDGLKGWVGKVGIIMPGNVLVLDSWQPIQLCLHLPDKKNAHGPVEEALVAMKINDGVRFSTKPDDTYKMPRVVGTTFHGFNQQIKLETITSVEKLAIDSPAPPAKPPGNRKEP